LSLANGVGLAEQDQECSLKSVVDLGFLPKQATANTAHHHPMPLDQSGESHRVFAFDKPLEQFPVRWATLGRTNQLVQVPHQRLQRLSGHGVA
jgi:hypothetical protein